jgi:hypothetical protein
MRYYEALFPDAQVLELLLLLLFIADRRDKAALLNLVSFILSSKINSEYCVGR